MKAIKTEIHIQQLTTTQSYIHKYHKIEIFQHLRHIIIHLFIQLMATICICMVNIQRYNFHEAKKPNSIIFLVIRRLKGN